MEVEFDSEIDIKSPDDQSDCKIYACALISTNQIILADAGNKCVKVIDVEQRKLLTRYKFESEPFSIAVLSGTLIGIVLPDEKKIVFLKLSQSGELASSYEIKVNGNCQGLASCDNNLLILYQDHIEITDSKGQEIAQITHSVWDCLMGIALSKEGGTFYVTDSPLFGNAKVFKFDFDGNIIATYEDKSLSDVRGLSVTKDGSVLVCNYDNNGSVHVISPECKKLRQILKGDRHVRYPWCISYCDESKKLFVCNNELELELNLRNILKIFKLKGI